MNDGHAAALVPGATSDTGRTAAVMPKSSASWMPVVTCG